MDDCFNLIGFEKGYEQGKIDAKKECDTCLFSTRKEKVKGAYQQGRADAIIKILDFIKFECCTEDTVIKVLEYAEQLKEQKNE